jgi:hypothetical protein
VSKTTVIYKNYLNIIYLNKTINIDQNSACTYGLEDICKLKELISKGHDDENVDLML